MLVTDPAEVDSRIDVKRPEPPTAACPAEVQRAAPRPEDFVLLGYVDECGVPTAGSPRPRTMRRGFESEPGVSYRGKGWVLVDVGIRNPPGQPPWTPREATLTGKGGVDAAGAARDGRQGRGCPRGVRVRVLAVADEPPPSAGVVFTLEVRGEDGRSLVIPRVTLPKRRASNDRAPYPAAVRRRY